MVNDVSIDIMFVMDILEKYKRMRNCLIISTILLLKSCTMLVILCWIFLKGKCVLITTENHTHVDIGDSGE